MFEVTKDTFEAEVLRAEGKVLVDYYGDDCPLCKALAPHLETLAGTYGDRMKFVSLNAPKARRLAISQRILGIPVVSIYENGLKVAELVRDQATPEAVEAMIQAQL